RPPSTPSTTAILPAPGRKPSWLRWMAGSASAAGAARAGSATSARTSPEAGWRRRENRGTASACRMEALPMLTASSAACKAEPDEGRERARLGEGTGPVGPTARRRPNQTCACFQRFPAKQLLRRPSLEPTRPHAAYIPPCQQDKQWVRTGPDGQYC